MGRDLRPSLKWRGQGNRRARGAPSPRPERDAGLISTRGMTRYGSRVAGIAVPTRGDAHSSENPYIFATSFCLTPSITWFVMAAIRRWDAAASSTCVNTSRSRLADTSSRPPCQHIITKPHNRFSARMHPVMPVDLRRHLLRCILGNGGDHHCRWLPHR